MSIENHEHDPPCASLQSAEPLFVEMLRQIIEEGAPEVSFFNSGISAANIGFSVSAFEDGDVIGQITGTRAVKYNHGLGERELDRLIQRGWTLPREEGVDVNVPSCKWRGVTTHNDRCYLAQEMLAIATDIYEIPPEEKIYFQLCHDGRRRTADSASC